MVDIVNWAPVRRSSMSEFAVRPSRSVRRRGTAALASLDINQWRTLADSTVEPNAYYLADWELALDASARDRTNASVLTARDDIPSSECGAGALLGLIPVISAWRAFRIPLPVLVSADPYGTLCTPLLDHDLANDAAATLLREARAIGQHALILRNVALDGAAMKAFTVALERDGIRPHTLQAHARACLDARRATRTNCCATRSASRSSRSCAASAIVLRSMATFRFRSRALLAMSRERSKPS